MYFTPSNVGYSDCVVIKHEATEENLSNTKLKYIKSYTFYIKKYSLSQVTLLHFDA